MTTTYLSPDELRELTGCAHRARQQKWLDRNRWPYAIAETGHIRVLRQYWLGPHHRRKIERTDRALRHASQLLGHRRLTTTRHGTSSHHQPWPS